MCDIRKERYKRLVLLVFVFSFISVNLPCVSAADIAVVNSENIKPYAEALEGAKGVINANFTVYNLEDKLQNEAEVVSSINSKKPDVILLLGAKAAHVINKDVQNIPLVYCMVSNPEKYNISGNNITGVKSSIPIEKQVDTLNNIFPKMKTVGIIYSSDEVKNTVDEIKTDFASKKINVIAVKVDSADKIPDAVEEVTSKADVFWLIYDPVVTSSERIVTDWIILPTLKKKIPIVGFNKWSVSMGALLCLYSDYKDIGIQAANIAKEILSGVSPGSIKVSSPKDAKILINYKVLKRIAGEVNMNYLKNAYIYEEN
jgi:putative ABC transport system substrate-binding protein